MSTTCHVKSLDDVSLIARLTAMASAERQNQVELLVHLAEMDERKLYLGQGYSSLWAYCLRSLRFSESVSQQRIVVARVSRSYPLLLSMLEDGRLTICTAADLAPVLTAENAEKLLAEAAFKTRREVQALAQTRGVKPRERDMIRRIDAVAAPVQVVQKAELETTNFTLASPEEPSAPEPTAAPKPRHRISFTASDDVLKKLERVKELLGTANLEEAVAAAADALLDRADPVRREARRKKRQNKIKTPRPPRQKATNPRRPPLALRDETIVSDESRCSYVSSAGVRCNERRHLTIDHIRPWALGGASTDPSNLRSMCSRHNLYLARQTFGPLPRQAKSKADASAS